MIVYVLNSISMTLASLLGLNVLTCLNAVIIKPHNNFHAKLLHHCANWWTKSNSLVIRSRLYYHKKCEYWLTNYFMISVLWFCHPSNWMAKQSDNTFLVIKLILSEIKYFITPPLVLFFSKIHKRNLSTKICWFLSN